MDEKKFEELLITLFSERMVADWASWKRSGDQMYSKNIELWHSVLSGRDCSADGLGKAAFQAARCGAPKLIHRFHGMGADMDWFEVIETPEGPRTQTRSIIAEAARMGQAECIATLIALGADLDAVDLKGARPIHHAMLGKHQLAARVLIGRQADLTSKDQRGISGWDLISKSQEPNLMEAALASMARREAQVIDLSTQAGRELAPGRRI